MFRMQKFLLERLIFTLVCMLRYRVAAELMWPLGEQFNRDQTIAPLRSTAPVLTFNVLMNRFVLGTPKAKSRE